MQTKLHGREHSTAVCQGTGSRLAAAHQQDEQERRAAERSTRADGVPPQQQLLDCDHTSKFAESTAQKPTAGAPTFRDETPEPSTQIRVSSPLWQCRIENAAHARCDHLHCPRAGRPAGEAEASTSFLAPGRDQARLQGVWLEPIQCLHAFNRSPTTNPLHSTGCKATNAGVICDEAAVRKPGWSRWRNPALY